MLAMGTAGYTGADLQAYVREAAVCALEEDLESSQVCARLSPRRRRARAAVAAGLRGDGGGVRVVRARGVRVNYRVTMT